MWKSNISCPECGAGYRRIELASVQGVKGEYCCLTCDHVLEVFDGSLGVLIRFTVQPERTRVRVDPWPLFGKGSIRKDGRTLHDMYLFEVKRPVYSC